MQLISSSFPRGIHGFPVLFARNALFRLLDERRNFFAEGGKLPLQIDALKDRRADKQHPCKEDAQKRFYHVLPPGYSTCIV